MRRGAHHPVIRALARNAKVKQLIVTFGETFKRHIFPSTGRMHGGTIIAGRRNSVIERLDSFKGSSTSWRSLCQ